jgi:hypothetical protein
MSISTELLLCGGLLAGLWLLGLATVRLLSKRLEKADREDFSVDIPAPEEAAKSGPSMQDVQAAIDELTWLATAPVGSKAKEAPGRQPTLPTDRAQLGRQHKASR